ncbi:twin-arginine translocase subunit TatB [Aquabacter sp. L1I39]|uniref:Sec-independent protein translocase protein TatB n=1 Tax=Aquabacter sp. L1I39 TaxID=2820278 RepID=UPI001ADCE5E6|nr:Sec-independent protein translocase protein TatB [Aquabacter sp. L1I39]QTL02641.1 twin-arginine translocase subunit TatB [Aquabacter sp. L1I39]
MFDIGWSELMLIGVVALIVIGPKELPSVLRTVGRTVTKVRRMAGEFQGQFQDALREAELSDVRKEIGDIAEGARKTFPGTEVFDPLRSIREEIRSTVTGIAAPAAATAAASTVEAAPTVPVTMEPVPLPDPLQIDPLQAVRDEIRAAVEKGVSPALTQGGTTAAPLVDAPAPELVLPLPEPPAEPVFNFAPPPSTEAAPASGPASSSASEAPAESAPAPSTPSVPSDVASAPTADDPQLQRPGHSA